MFYTQRNARRQDLIMANRLKAFSKEIAYFSTRTDDSGDGLYDRCEKNERCSQNG